MGLVASSRRPVHAFELILEAFVEQLVPVLAKEAEQPDPELEIEATKKIASRRMPRARSAS